MKIHILLKFCMGGNLIEDSHDEKTSNVAPTFVLG